MSSARSRGRQPACLILVAALMIVTALTGCSSARQENSKQTTIIHAGHVIVSPAEPPKVQQSIVISDERIVAIAEGYIRQPGARYVDQTDAWVLPGLIDLHVHLTTNPDKESFEREATATTAELYEVAVRNAAATIAAGFTTVLDLGTGLSNHERAIYRLRARVNSGAIPGPTVLTVGSPISSPGLSRKPTHLDIQGVCSGAQACSQAVLEQVRRGADLISFYNTGSLLSQPSAAQAFSLEEMKAIVQTAHQLDRRVIADGGNTNGDPSGIINAIEAGVDALDTVTFADTKTWKSAVKKDVYFVPHLYALQAAVGNRPDTLAQGTMGWLPAPVLEFLYQLKQMPQSAAHAHRSGVAIAFGSDPGVFPHGDNAREFSELIKAGLDPRQAIAAATTNAAAVLGLENEIGSIHTGRFADLIAVEANPFQNINVLANVKFVMRRGATLDINDD